MKVLAAKLLAAARLIDEARAELDDSGAPCGSCGLHVDRNHQEALVAAQLQGISAKLRKFATARAGQEVLL